MEKRHGEYQYLELLREIKERGVEKRDHNTGNSLYSVFVRTLRFDLQEGFPLLTTKKMFWKGVLHELFWFMKGHNNVKYLVDNGVHIWDEYPYKVYQEAAGRGEVPEMSLEDFAERIKSSERDSGFVKKWGEMPRIYGELWRKWPASDGRKIDQLAWVVETLKKTPHRKHACMSAWNPEYLYAMAKPEEAIRYPLCHVWTHFNHSEGKLSLHLNQRSCDAFLGVPFNIASYALLTNIVAHVCGYEPGEFVHTLEDVHIYRNHMKAVDEQLTREPKPFPRIVIDPCVRSLDEIQPEHIRLEGYESHGVLRAPLTPAGGFDEKDRERFGFGRN